MQFNRNMLPLLGVTWHRFPTHAQARAFASWAERETRRDEYPCESFILRQDDADPSERWEVKVRNW